jgi:hypothetical protein
MSYPTVDFVGAFLHIQLFSARKPNAGKSGDLTGKATWLMHGHLDF